MTMETPDAAKTVSCLSNTCLTSVKSRETFSPRKLLPQISLLWNGTSYFEEKQHVSTPSIALSDIWELFARIEGVLGSMRLSLESALQFKRSRHVGNGWLQPTFMQKPSDLHSQTEIMSFRPTSVKFLTSLLQNKKVPTAKLLPMIKPSGQELVVEQGCYLQINLTSLIFVTLLSMLMGLTMEGARQWVQDQTNPVQQLSQRECLAGNGIA